MSKAILIMDMPEYCRDCPVCHRGVCNALGMPVAAERHYNPCPLRELPEPREEYNIDEIGLCGGTDFILAVQNAAYNECLKEITGGDE